MIAKLKRGPEEQRLRLSLVPWPAYVAFCDGLGERHLRVTYDQGEMEVMTLSFEHENRKSLLKSFLQELVVELEIDTVSGGSMTCRREEMLRGLEPDECYWIATEPEVRGRTHIDLDNDPPPDLALEIEISRSALNRMSIYAVLKVPEVWRWDGSALSVHLLTPRGTYRASKRSKAFSFLPLDEFSSFLARADLSETQLLRAFRKWVREHRERWGQ